MLNPTREYFIKNAVLMESWQFDPDWIKRRKTVYEVLRVINGNPLFAEEHISRLFQSAIYTGIKDVPDPAMIMQSITKLIRACNSDDGNILFCIVRNNAHVHTLACYVGHRYPTQEEYTDGVKIRTMKAIRKLPNAKIWNTAIRKQAEYLMSSSDAYEVLLIDKKRNITEGSKSNIFFIRGNSIFTTPESKVLMGITRQKVKELCDKKLIGVGEKEITINELQFYESAFLSGTSSGILPVKMIDKVRFNVSNRLMRKLMASYDNMVETSIHKMSE